MSEFYFRYKDASNKFTPEYEAELIEEIKDLQREVAELSSMIASFLLGEELNVGRSDD